MQAVSNLLTPFGVNGNAISDTLVRSLMYTIKPATTDVDLPPETRRPWWHCRDRSSRFHVCMEWFC